MRWQGREESGNVEDRRGFSVGKVGGIGGIGAVIVTLIALYFGQDPTKVLQQLNGDGAPSESQGTYQESSGEAEARHMISVVLKDTEQTWQQIFAAHGRNYVEPKLVLFSDAVQSACGTADSAVGPFYCSGDSRVYLDLSFFNELSQRFGAPGDFARAYVVAHEVGHHVQHLLGTTNVRGERNFSRSQSNEVSVRIELQADCYAGIWAHEANASHELIEAGDIDQGLAAAAAVGDDRLQKQTRGYVVPESFTHGSSEQRVRWFKKGFASGRLADCDTFKTTSSRAL